MSQYTLENLIQKFKSDVAGKWHAEGRKGNDGSVGNTLEDLLGVSENNLKLPDWGDIELKTKQKESQSLVTLLHKEPSPAKSVPKLLLSLGWRHKEAGIKYPSDELSFRSTTRADSYSDRGFAISLCEEKITFVFDPTKVNDTEFDKTNAYATYGDWLNDIGRRNPHYSSVLPVFWNKQDVLTEIRKKLDNTLYCVAKTKKENNVKFFKFESAILFSKFNPSKFDILFSEKALYVDFDARTHHNHGTKFRVNLNSISKLFDISVDILE